MRQDALKNQRRRRNDCKPVNNGCRERSAWALQRLRFLMKTRMTLLLIKENKDWRRRVFSGGRDVFTFTPECLWRELGLNFTVCQASLAPRTNRRPRGDTNSLNWQTTFCTGFLSRISRRKLTKPGYSTVACYYWKKEMFPWLFWRRLLCTPSLFPLVIMSFWFIVWKYIGWILAAMDAAVPFALPWLIPPTMLLE